MGPWRTIIFLVILFVTAAEEQGQNTSHKTDRRGKALKISKKPCSDPSGKQGICTFKWDCIKDNGTLMGTCMDGFIFGTCCHHASDPFLYEDDPFLQDTNKITDHNEIAWSTTPTTTASPIPRITPRPTLILLNRITTTTSTRPPMTRPSTTKRPLTTADVTTSSPPLGQLVTWTSIGPTRRPIPQRPVFFTPFPVRPVPSQALWPVGVAIPVDPFNINRPLQIYRPQFYQVGQTVPATSQVVRPSVNYTILNGSDGKSTSTTSKNVVEMTTVSVPIPQWSTPNSVTSSAYRPGSIFNRYPTTMFPTTSRPGSVSSTAAYTRPPLYSASLQPSLSNQTQTLRKPVLDYRKDCGVRSLTPKARIVGGQSAYFGRWPWQVLVKEAAWLGLYQKNKCGGVLISAKYAITAGHCQPGRFLSSLVVILGEHDLLTDLTNLKPEMRRVKRMIVHRHYNPQNFDNDIALLELDPPVVFRPHISPVCLPEANDDFTGKMAYVTGWGKTAHGGAIPNLLQEVQVPIVSNNECIDMFKEAGHDKLIKDSFLCAGYKTGGKDSCEGDSGGPLMVEKETGQWYLAGTVSHGIRCADPNLPGVYMRISSYKPWIDKIIN